MANVKIRTALVSVSDKTGLPLLGACFKSLGIHVLSTGGTFKLLKETGVDVEEVAHYTGSPEMMDGRVKTLHPRIHGGLLGRLNADGTTGTDAGVMKAQGIKAIDMVVANLYPFEKTVADPGVSLADAIENIDIGGPGMLRSAAKNFDRVSIVVDPADYPAIIAELEANHGSISYETRFRLAVKAFARVADYDVAIASYLSGITDA